MIKSFKCKEIKKIYERSFSKKLPQDIQQKAYQKLIMLDSAFCLNDLKIPPSNHLETLSGDLKDFYSIRINKQYRICFRWHQDSAFDVFITDYH